MNSTELPQDLEGENISLIHQDNNCVSYRITNTGGEMMVTMYSVFPGIWIVYNDAHLASCTVCLSKPAGNIIEIEHCREGRIEYQEDEHYFYLAQGDIAIRKKAMPEREWVFPSGHYHGAAILIDLEQTPKCLACVMSDVDVEPYRLVDQFRLEDNHHVALRQLPSMEHIFSELYTVPESIRKGYHKIKVLEILLFLSSLEPDEETPRRLSRKQVTLAKEVSRFLTEHLNDRITIDALARIFSTSPTQLKTSFRDVYGTSVQTFQREQKMQAAARLLRTTDMTVQEIAGRFGYANSSKFSAAFQSVMEMAPNEYRIK